MHPRLLPLLPVCMGFWKDGKYTCDIQTMIHLNECLDIDVLQKERRPHPLMREGGCNPLQNQILEEGG